MTDFVNLIAELRGPLPYFVNPVDDRMELAKEKLKDRQRRAAAALEALAAERDATIKRAGEAHILKANVSAEEIRAFYAICPVNDMAKIADGLQAFVLGRIERARKAAP